MPDIGLDRADGAVAALIRIFAERRGQGSVLDRIAQPRSSTVGLHHLDLLRADAEAVINLTLEPFLRQCAGRGDSVRRTILIDPRAADHTMNVVPIGQRLRQTLEHDDANALARHKAIRPRIEGVTLPVR